MERLQRALAGLPQFGFTVGRLGLTAINISPSLRQSLGEVPRPLAGSSDCSPFTGRDGWANVHSDLEFYNWFSSNPIFQSLPVRSVLDSLGDPVAQVLSPWNVAQRDQFRDKLVGDLCLSVRLDDLHKFFSLNAAYIEDRQIFEFEKGYTQPIVRWLSRLRVKPGINAAEELARAMKQVQGLSEVRVRKIKLGQSWGWHVIAKSQQGDQKVQHAFVATDDSVVIGSDIATVSDGLVLSSQNLGLNDADKPMPVQLKVAIDLSAVEKVLAVLSKGGDANADTPTWFPWVTRSNRFAELSVRFEPDRISITSNENSLVRWMPAVAPFALVLVNLFLE